MRVLVFGAKGVLGKEVVTAANNARLDIIWPDRNDVDITDSYEVHQCFLKSRPEVVINCAGLVKSREVSDTRFIMVNGIAPHCITSECDSFGSKLIQISTDCVFSGRTGSYTEDDIPDPVDIYGISKLAGEIKREPHLTIRTSFIGFGNRGLLAWLLEQKGQIPGYVDSFWNGLTAAALSRIIINLSFTDVHGLLHIHSSGVLSKFDLLNMLNVYLELNLEIVPTKAPDKYRVNRSLCSVIDMMKYYTVPTMDKMMEELSITNKLMIEK